MRNKKVFFVIASIFSILVFSGAAYAANNAAVSVTSEPIRASATCDKAGGIVITFDEGTTLVEGDQITMDLTLNVTLCRDIDIEISPGGSGNMWEGEDFAAAGNVPVTGAPLLCPTDDVGNAVLATGAGGGVYFHVYGTDGTARVTIDVLGDLNNANALENSLTITDATVDADTLKLYLLNQNINADYTQNGVYIDLTGDGTYGAFATIGDNTLCIDVSNPVFTGSTVTGNFDSKGDKFTFIPSNPQIAHIAPALLIAFDPCKAREPGHIVIGDRITQGTDTCDAFDNESEAGFCNDHANNNMVIGASSPFDLAQYQVTMEILVNGLSGDNGVYWSNEAPQSEGYDNKDDACDALSTDGTALGAATYELANESAATPEAPHIDDCDVAANGRAVVMNIADCDLNLVANDDYLWFDLPAFNYDLDDIQEGDVVTVEITINKVPCGVYFTGVWEIGTFGCQAAGFTSTILFPYFTNMEGDTYWDGISIVNLGSTDGTATLTVYEADGDVATMTVAVSANSMYVNLLSAMVSGMTLTTSVDGTLGNARNYISVTADFNVDGFAMMARSDTGESMGYLPRLSVH